MKRLFVRYLIVVLMATVIYSLAANACANCTGFVKRIERSDLIVRGVAVFDSYNETDTYTTNGESRKYEKPGEHYSVRIDEVVFAREPEMKFIIGDKTTTTQAYGISVGKHSVNVFNLPVKEGGTGPRIQEDEETVFFLKRIDEDSLLKSEFGLDDNVYYYPTCVSDCIVKKPLPGDESYTEKAPLYDPFIEAIYGYRNVMEIECEIEKVKRLLELGAVDNMYNVAVAFELLGKRDFLLDKSGDILKVLWEPELIETNPECEGYDDDFEEKIKKRRERRKIETKKILKKMMEDKKREKNTLEQ